MNSAFTVYLSISVRLFWGPLVWPAKLRIHHSRASVVLQILAVPHVNLLQRLMSHMARTPLLVFIFCISYFSQQGDKTPDRNNFWAEGFTLIRGLPRFQPTVAWLQEPGQNIVTGRVWVEGRERGRRRRGKGRREGREWGWRGRAHLPWKLLKFLIMTIFVFLFEWPNLGVNLLH